jgi:hypothetical protein
MVFQAKNLQGKNCNIGVPQKSTSPRKIDGRNKTSGAKMIGMKG